MRLLPSSLIIMATLLPPLGCGFLRESNSTPKIVILYLVDTLRSDHLQPYGYMHETSPNLLAFCKDAVRFENVYSTAPWTKPSVASILTSQYPTTHGAKDRRDRLSESLLTAAEVFQAEGWETIALVANPWISEQFGFRQGFDTFISLDDLDLSDVTIEKLIEETKRIIRRRDPTNPLFLYIHSMEPHSPYHPPKEYVDLVHPDYNGKLLGTTSGVAILPVEDLKVLYDCEIRYNDYYFGQLLRFLEELNLYDKTTIVYTSDHGEEFLEHGKLGHRGNLWEPLVRVPLIVKSPRLPAGTISTPISILDVLPTLVALCRFDGDKYSFSGRPLLQSAAQTVRLTERPLFMEEGSIYGIRDGEWKAIYRVAQDEQIELYRIPVDRLEQIDISEDHHQKAAEFRRILESRLAMGQSGYWIVAMGGAEEITIRGGVRIAGAIKNIERLSFERVDSLFVTEDGLTFTITLRPPKDSRSFKYRNAEPRKSIRIQTEPTLVDLTVALNYGSGKPMDRSEVIIGEDHLNPDSVPVNLPATSRDISILGRNIPDEITEDGLQAMVFIGYVSPPEQALIDEEKRKQLEALGYLH